MNCKIGLISFPVNSQKYYFLNLGEIYDKNVRRSPSLLYEFHKNLQYFCEFTATIDASKVFPDNIEEIKFFQRKYKLTPKIFLSDVENEFYEKMEFSAPQLYDMSCMVPLFSEKISKCVYVDNKATQTKLFIILPYTDPILRGKIIKNCLKSVVDTKGYFLTIGNKKGMNRVNSCELDMRYLLSCGVPEKYIMMNEYEEFPDFIAESLNIANMIFYPDTVFIGVSTEEVGKILSCVRILRKEGDIIDKLFFICN